MSNPKFESMFVAQKASSEVLVAIMRTSFEGMQRLAELNMAAAKGLLNNTAASASALASTKDVNDLSRISSQLAKPEQMMEYWRSVYDLVNGMQKEVSTVMQANYSQLTKTAAATIEQRKSAALDGSDAMANAMKDVIETTNKAFDNMSAVTSQMASIAGATMKPASSKGSGKK